MTLFSSKQDRRRAFVYTLLVVLVLLGFYAAARRYIPFLFDAEALRAWISQFGVLAPFALIVVHVFHVVVAPIPGPVVALTSGYLFGPIWGTIYSLTGVLLGSALAFSLAKRFGRPFVEDVLDAEAITRFDGFVERIGLPGLVAFVLVPGLPDDFICLVSGLTTWRLRTFLVAICIGRLPAYVLTVYAGDQLATGQLTSALLVIGFLVVLSVIGYRNQEAIRSVIERLG